MRFDATGPPTTNNGVYVSSGEGKTRSTWNPVNVLRFVRFAWRVVRNFLDNKGLLLAGAVGYNALLSVIPLFAVILVILSRIVDRRLLLDIVTTELEVVFPGQALTMRATLVSFLDSSTVVGWVGFGVLLFFASIAFRMLEDAMSVIFRHHSWEQSRHPLISALIPFGYITVIGVIIFFITLATGIFDSLAGDAFSVFGKTFSIETTTSLLLRGAALLGTIALLASFYRVMPVARVRWKLAVVGATVAAVLWEGVRTFLVWYFENISLVNVVYGSLATVIVVLLSMEVAAVIVLLGAQVIAEVEKSAEAEVPWYEEPPGPEPITGHMSRRDSHDEAA
jgi:YihY family inner membrane protein